MKRALRLEKKAVLSCAALMAAAARTAPKTRGIDNIVTCVIDDAPGIRRLARSMLAIYKLDNRPSLKRDAGSIKEASAVVLIGVRDNPAGLNCGFCGCKRCEVLKAKGGACAFNSIDLGIAVGSSVSVAANFRVDNRVMYSIGRAALKIGTFGKGVRQALGIPLSASGKNPFFDRL